MIKIFAVAVSVFVLVLVSSAEHLPQQPPPPTQGIRQNVAGMDENHPVLMSYRKAVDAMKKLPATDPRSWQFQANIHGAQNNDGVNDAWRWCMHGNWYFLPWHRGYLMAFEAHGVRVQAPSILRQLELQILLFRFQKGPCSLDGHSEPHQSRRQFDDGHRSRARRLETTPTASASPPGPHCN